MLKEYQETNGRIYLLNNLKKVFLKVNINDFLTQTNFVKK